MKRELWTAQQYKRLIVLWREGKHIKEIMDDLGKNKYAIYGALDRLRKGGLYVKRGTAKSQFESIIEELKSDKSLFD